MANVSNARIAQYERLDEVIAQWKDEPGGLLPIMQNAQELLGCVDEEVQKYISEKTGAPIAEIFGIATFYSQFTLQPKGKYNFGLCLGTACYVKGSQNVMDEIVKQIGVDVGCTTEDGLFTIEATRCIGCCGLAPAMMVNDEVYGRLVPSDIPGIVEKYRKLG